MLLDDIYLHVLDPGIRTDILRLRAPPTGTLVTMHVSTVHTRTLCMYPYRTNFHQSPKSAIICTYKQQNFFWNFQINHNSELAMPSKAFPFPTGIGIDLIQRSRIESIFKGSLQIQSMGRKGFSALHFTQTSATRFYIGLRETYKTNFRPQIDPAQKNMAERGR